MLVMISTRLRGNHIHTGYGCPHTRPPCRCPLNQTGRVTAYSGHFRQSPCLHTHLSLLHDFWVGYFAHLLCSSGARPQRFVRTTECRVKSRCAREAISTCMYASPIRVRLGLMIILRSYRLWKLTIQAQLIMFPRNLNGH